MTVAANDAVGCRVGSGCMTPGNFFNAAIPAYGGPTSATARRPPALQPGAHQRYLPPATDMLAPPQCYQEYHGWCRSGDRYIKAEDSV